MFSDGSQLFLHDTIADLHLFKGAGDATMSHGEGWSFLHRPWMAVKLLTVVALSGWHGFLAGEFKRIQAGTSVRTGKFWRMTNEVPFLIAIVAVLAVTTEGVFD